MQDRVQSMSRRKRATFVVILFALPFLVVILAELIFRSTMPLAGTKDPYVNVSPFTIFSREVTDGKEYAHITHRLAYANRNIRFPIDKPVNSIRVFVLGGSAAAGWPHDSDQVFSSYLEALLENTYPETDFEIINAAAHGFASFRVRHIFDDVIEMQPDAVVVYSGNNEFLEKRDYSTQGVRILNTVASHSRLIQWLQGLFRSARFDLPANELNEVAQFFWKKVRRQALELREDPAQFEQVKAHYRHTLSYMSEKAERLGIPLFLATVPVNLRDWLPTVSVNRLEGTSLQTWEKHYRLGQRDLILERFTESSDGFAKAIQLEPEHAETHFWQARALESRGDTPEALREYSLARDLDYNPFRAISDFNATIRDIAAEASNTSLVDLDQVFIENSDTGVPGFDLFLDYVHPNTYGNRIITEALYRAFRSHKTMLADHKPSNEVSSGRDITIRIDYDDTRDPEIQARLFSLYSMNHQYHAAIGNVKHLQRLLGSDTMRAQLSIFPERMREGYRVFTAYESARRGYFLGETAEQDLVRARQELDSYYEKWHPYGKY